MNQDRINNKESENFDDQVLTSLSALATVDDIESLIAKYKEVIKEKNYEIEQYKESNYLLEQFAISVAHDIKSPIRTISSFAKLLELNINSDEEDSNEQATEFLMFIQKATADLGKLVTETLSNVKVGSSELSKEYFDPEELIEYVLKKISTQIEATDCSVEIDNIPKSVYANRLMIDSVLQNLISNALKFKKEEALLLQISGKENEDSWVLSISDNGIGVSEKKAELIFCQFVKLNQEIEGNGIGLSTCMRIMKRHGGDIWLDSEVGVGSTFHIRIPKV
ncbi:MAG: ATP-binding protein [Saprospiraceae bacterium]